jgi:ribonuclease J
VAIGLIGSDEEAVLADVRARVAAAVGALTGRAYADDQVVQETVRLVVRRSFRQLFEKKPVTHVHLVRLHEGQRREA